MKKFLCLCVVLVFSIAGWAGPRLVLYSPGFALVEETRELELEAHGTIVLDGLPQQWLPDSLVVDGLTVLRARPLGVGDLLTEAMDPRAQPDTPVAPFDLVGQLVQVVAGGRTLTGRLLSAGENLVLATLEGTVVLPDYEQLTVPQPLGAAVEIEYEAAEGPTEITLCYLTEGLRWSTQYAAVLGDELLTLTGQAQLVNTTGMSFTKAQVELIAGDIDEPTVREAVRADAPLALAAAPRAEVEIAPAAEYQRYTLPEPVDLSEGTIYTPLVTGETPYERVYQFRGGPVRAFITFDNDLAPLPAGEVRVFDEGGSLFAGAARIGHTPVDETIELDIGSAFDLTGERVHLRRERPTDQLYRDTYRIVIRSAKDEDVTVQALESMRGTWNIIRTTEPYEAVSAQEIRFDLQVTAGGDAIVEYTVEGRH
ncbi:MAG: hypothetical protein R6U88_00955 [Candidatus Bipolaricaulota bacterium]